MEDSVFTKIIKGEIPSAKIYEDDVVLAFLTIQPFSEGHTLVVPKKQVDQLWDLDDDTYAHLMVSAKEIGAHLREATGSVRVGMVVKGFEVPHVHVHLIPMRAGEHTNLDPTEDAPMADFASLTALAEELRLT
ncbi:MAG: HIT family protein [Candidatus Saccharimonas sp.]